MATMPMLLLTSILNTNHTKIYDKKLKRKKQSKHNRSLITTTCGEGGLLDKLQVQLHLTHWQPPKQLQVASST
jgi:hypothetical protein